MRTRYRAYCYASGQIEIGIYTPNGAIEIATGPARALKSEIGVVARHAYDGETMLVPGVPEAESPEDKLQALCHFVEWAGDRIAPAASWRTANQIRADFAQLQGSPRLDELDGDGSLADPESYEPNGDMT